MREKLREAREAADMTQTKIAEYLCIGVRQYRRIEAGDCIGRAQLWDALEDLFKVPQRELRANSATGAQK